MNKIKKDLFYPVKHTLFTLGLFVAVCGTASAQGWYGGVSLGQATVDVDAEEATCGFWVEPGVTCSEDDSDSSFKLYAGVEINPNFAVEFGYADLGAATLSARGFGEYVNLKYETMALFVTANGIMPVSPKVKLFGKAGLARWDVDLSGTSSIPDFNGSISDDGFDLLLGFGASFNVTQNIDARVEYELFTVGDSGNTGEADIDVLSVGATMKF